MYGDKIFQAYPNTNNLMQTIPIATCDITSLFDILSNVSEFPTCKTKYRRSLTCKYKQSTQKSQHNTICCHLCLTCMNCQENPACESISLRLALAFIKDFRNFSAHVTPEECREIENNIYKSINICNCNSWTDVLKEFTIHSDNILRILLTEKKIDFIEHRKRTGFICDVVTTDSNVYYNVVRKLEITLDKRPSKSWFKRCLGGNISRTNSIVKRISIAYINKIEQLLHTELGLQQKQQGKLKIVCSCFKVGASSNSLFPVIAEFNITFCNGDKLPKCYEHAITNESILLQENIQKCLEQAIRDEVKEDLHVDCVGWKIGSLHITYEIWKSNGTWNHNERENIQEIITKTNICFKNHPMCSSSQVLFPCASVKEEYFVSYIFNIWIFDDTLVAPITNALPRIKIILENITHKKLMKNKENLTGML